MSKGGGASNRVDWGSVSTTCDMVAVGDFSDARTPDILFRNPTTGDTVWVTVARGTNALSWHGLGATQTSYSTAVSPTCG